MSWYNKISQWRETARFGYLIIGERDSRWIASFEKDLNRWGFDDLKLFAKPVTRSKFEVRLLRKIFKEADHD